MPITSDIYCDNHRREGTGKVEKKESRRGGEITQINLGYEIFSKYFQSFQNQ